MGPKAMVTTGSIFQILAKPHKQKNLIEKYEVNILESAIFF